MTRLTPCLIVLFLATAGAPRSLAESFDLSNAIIPAGEVYHGGPPKDGIPSIDDPKFAPVAKIDFLKDEDLIFGFEFGGVRRAYPFRVLVWHEIVNDTVGDLAVAITYCPLCGTAMAFERSFEGKAMTFGVSGLLYESDVLMYDRATESLWSQLAMKSVSGPRVGTELKWLPGEVMTWAAWKKTYPETEVLTTETGVPRDYDRMPYFGYEDQPDTVFPVSEHRRELGNKEWVAGLFAGGKAVAFPLDALAQAGGETSEAVGAHRVEITYEAGERRILSATVDGIAVPIVQVHWFAWQAFYPETHLWKP